MSRSTHVQRAAIALTVMSLLGAVYALSAPAAPATPAKGTAAPAKGAAPAAPAAATKGDAAAGKTIFMTKCIVCHKADGSGGVKLTGNPTPNWKDPKTWADPKRTDAYLRDCITNGKTPSGMVAWVKTGQVKAADVDNLIAFIHSLAPKKK
jgi:mono/diheme cytochrome c family protein